MIFSAIKLYHIHQLRFENDTQTTWKKIQPAFLLPCRIWLVKPVVHGTLQQLLNFSAHQWQNQAKRVWDAIAICAVHRVKDYDGFTNRRKGSSQLYTCISVSLRSGREEQKRWVVQDRWTRPPEGTYRSRLCWACSRHLPSPRCFCHREHPREEAELPWFEFSRNSSSQQLKIRPLVSTHL